MQSRVSLYFLCKPITLPPSPSAHEDVSVCSRQVQLCVPRHELLPQRIPHSSQCFSQLFQEMKSKHYGQCHKQNLIVTRTCCAGRSQGKWLLLEKPSCPLPADKSVHTESPAHEQCGVGVSDTQDLTFVRAASMEILVPVTWEMLNKS